MFKKYEDLKFTDDFMFCKILETNPDLCKELLELILGQEVGSLVCVDRQKPIDITADRHGVRFDVYAKDDSNVIYDVEMQTSSKDSLPKRTRYAQGMIDLDALERSTLYKELPRSVIIYICTFNPFPGKERHKYTFVNLCREDPSIMLEDETAKVFLCAEGAQDDLTEDAAAFVNYMAGGKAETAFTRNLEKAVSDAARQNSVWRIEYMNFAEMLEIEREEGREEGREEAEKKYGKRIKELEAQVAALKASAQQDGKDHDD